MRLAYGNAHIHPDGNCDRYGHIHSDCNCNGNAYAKPDCNCHIHPDSDGNCHGNGDCDRTATTYTNATTPADTPAAPVGPLRQ